MRIEREDVTTLRSNCQSKNTGMSSIAIKGTDLKLDGNDWP